jgi:Integrase core domain
MDVKKIGPIPDGGGWKAHGGAMGSTGTKKRARIGFDYVHSVVDDHSRLAYSEILPDETGPTCAEFLLRAARYLADHGITRIERVMTDNHWSYGSRSTWLRRATPPSAPGARQVPCFLPAFVNLSSGACRACRTEAMARSSMGQTRPWDLEARRD